MLILSKAADLTDILGVNILISYSDRFADTIESLSLSELSLKGATLSKVETCDFSTKRVFCVFESAKILVG